MESEMSQALVRVKLGGFYLACILTGWFAGGGEYSRLLFYPALAYFSYSSIWVLVVRKQLIEIGARRNISIMLDQSLIGFNYFAAGEAFAAMFWVSAFATIGYGLRFGSVYAYRSIVFGTIFTAVGMTFNSFWGAHMMVGIGILGAGIVLPYYSIRLAETIVNGRKKAEEIATQLEHLNRVDYLTGLFNKRGLEYMFNQCTLRNTSGVLMYIDLDGFKQVNDSLGHKIGDEVLKEVAEVLRKCVRSSDTIARLGGDEFAILLTRLNDSDAFDIGEKIIVAINEISSKRPGTKVGASIGAASFAANMHDMHKLLADVDHLMYEAKRSGKNKVWFPGAKMDDKKVMDDIVRHTIDHIAHGKTNLFL